MYACVSFRTWRVACGECREVGCGAEVLPRFAHERMLYARRRRRRRRRRRKRKVYSQLTQ